MRSSLLTVGIGLCLALPARAELDPRRASGFFGGFLAGGGILDTTAIYTSQVAQDNALTNLGLLDVALRAGWRFPLVEGALGVAPLLETRAGLILGTLNGAIQSSFSFLGGAQLQLKPGREVMPYLNLRGGVRSASGTYSKTLAIGLGLELPFGPYSTLLELTAEPIAPWLVSFRAGVVFF